MELFEPEDIKNRYEREEDRKIKDEDIPERLQMRMNGYTLYSLLHSHLLAVMKAKVT